MKKHTTAIMFGIALIAQTTLGSSSPTLAATLTYSGVLSTPNSTPSFFFTADGTSTVSFKSYSYSGGNSTNGTVFSGGGFNPILTIFGTIAAFPDQFLFEIDNLPSAGDISSNRRLAAGNYRAVLSAAPNFAQGGSFSDGFTNINTSFGSGRTGFYAFDINNVTATATAVPEPASIIGTTLAGLAAIKLKRKLSVSNHSKR
jgi:hypothetical protein